MKTSLPAMVIASTLACTTSLASAGEGCLKNDQRNKELGHALGVLVFDSIVRDYSRFAKVEDIAAGLKHASNRTAFPLPGKTIVMPDPESKELSGGSLSVSEAQNIIKNWRSQSDQLGQRFMHEYKQRGTLQKSELLTYRLPLADVEFTNEGRDQIAKCTTKFLLSTESNLKQVCYLQLRIDEESICDANAEVIKAIDKPDTLWTYGEFNPENVIEGWAEAFKLLDKDSLKSEDTEPATAGAEPEKEFLEVLEVVIPSELAYGSKGMLGNVEPNETLWFVMVVK